MATAIYCYDNEELIGPGFHDIAAALSWAGENPSQLLDQEGEPLGRIVILDFSTKQAQFLEVERNVVIRLC